MTTPRVRFTVRSMMAVAAAAAVATGATLFVQRSTEAAHRNSCRSNLLSLSLGLMNYVQVYGSFPAGTVVNDRLTPEKRLSWLTVVMSFMDQWLWLFDMSESWDSSANRVTRGHGLEEEPRAVGRIAMLTCPAAADASDEHMPGRLWYVGIAGVGVDAPALPDGHPRAGVFGHSRQTPLESIRDGASNTLLLAETGYKNGPWTAGGAASVRGLDPSRQPYIGRGRQFGGLHRGGAMVAMADGSVRFVRESIDPNVFEALSTASGGERLPAGWDQ